MFISIIKSIRQPWLRHDGCPPYSTLHSMFTSWSEIVKFVNNCQTLKQLSIVVKKKLSIWSTNCQHAGWWGILFSSLWSNASKNTSIYDWSVVFLNVYHSWDSVWTATKNHQYRFKCFDIFLHIISALPCYVYTIWKRSPPHRSECLQCLLVFTLLHWTYLTNDPLG